MELATVTYAKLCLLFETTQPKSDDFTTVVAALKLNAVFNHEIKERWMFESMMQLCRMSIFDSVANNLSFSPFTLWLFRSLAHQQQLHSGTDYGHTKAKPNSLQPKFKSQSQINISDKGLVFCRNNG